MDRVSREIAQKSLTVEEALGEGTMGEPIPSPLAEIAARTADEKAKRSSPRKRRRSTQRRSAVPSRRKPRCPARQRLYPGEVLVGTLAGINNSGQPLVRHPMDPSGRVSLARTTVPIRAEQIDREVVIAFESGDIARPIVLGVLVRPDEPDSADPRSTTPTVRRPIVQATLDGEQLVLTAQNELVLRCGKASLTLTRAGKILIRGTYVLSRSSGVNRIKGGSVQLN
jgi:Domain of unknown function (DUF6484)